MEFQQIVELVVAVSTIIGSITYLRGKLAQFKTKLHSFRNFVDIVDAALEDDQITEEEFRKIWESGKKIIS